MDAQRLINAILLGDLTYDAVLLELWPQTEEGGMSDAPWWWSSPTPRDLPELPTRALVTADRLPERRGRPPARGSPSSTSAAPTATATKGYYVSLIADARGQQALPAVESHRGALRAVRRLPRPAARPASPRWTWRRRAAPGRARTAEPPRGRAERTDGRGRGLARRSPTSASCDDPRFRGRRAGRLPRVARARAAAAAACARRGSGGSRTSRRCRCRSSPPRSARRLVAALRDEERGAAPRLAAPRAS